MREFVLLARHPRYREELQARISNLPGRWYWFEEKKELAPKKIDRINPEYLFSLHWSWKIPEEIHQNYECVGFHMTDLPYGRGGSPLQNLILRGHETTKLTAFKLTEKMDAGPIYIKRTVSLDGRAEEILRRVAREAIPMIQHIVEKKPEPEEQQGEVVHFDRRQPEQSEIPEGLSIQELYDFVRMLDADEYPKAFIRKEGYRIEFTRPVLQNETLTCETEIIPAEGMN